MLFGWLKRRRRERLAARPFPDEWIDVLHGNVWHYGLLRASEQEQVRRTTQVFMEEKNWEGCGGLVMTDEVRVTIAAQMAILVLGFKKQYFDAVLSVLVYPDAYLAPEPQAIGSGVVIEGRSAREGEAWHRGPVILSWSDALAGGRGETPGHNLVLHEFAHQLDMLHDRVANGIPVLPRAIRPEHWTSTMEEGLEKLRYDCASGNSTAFDCYGTKNLAEFFAVATESFFEDPATFKQHDPVLYELFELYYRQDPLSRFGA